MTEQFVPKVIVSRKLPDLVETRLKTLFNTDLNLGDVPFTADQWHQALQTADVIVPTVTDNLDRELLSQAGPQLKMIASFGAGVDHIDLATARDRKIVVTNTPGVLTEDTADMTLALILSAARRLTEGERLIRSGQWQGWSPTGMLGHRLSGKRLGIVGLGRIGQAVARRAKAFDLEIHYHNRRQVHPEIEQELGATYWPSLEQMLARMDIVSLHCPKTPATYHLLNQRRLSRMQSHAILVNTSRGDVVDEQVLATLLSEGQLGGAALDVFEQEPAIHPALMKMDNVVVMPHMGSATYEARQAMGERVLINIKAFVDGHRAPDRVVKTDY